MTAPQQLAVAEVQDNTVPTNAPAQPQFDTVRSSAVTRRELCSSIVDATGCTPGDASGLVDLVGTWLNRARDNDSGVCYPYSEEMSTRQYHLFDAVVPHGQASVPGSVHAKMEGFFLTGDELAIKHDRVRDSDTAPEHCEVALGFRVQR